MVLKQFQTMEGVGRWKRICKNQRCMSCGRRGTRDISIRQVKRSGCRFPETGYAWEHQIFRFATMVLRHRCSTSFDVASLFRGRHNTLDRSSGTITKRKGTRPSVLHSTFIFDGRLAEFIRFGVANFHFLRKSCFG